LLNFCTNPTGLAAPAIAAGFTALVPTLHTLVPIIGASGFAAIATAAGHTAGSVAVAASFGGEPNKMLPDYYYSGDAFFISHYLFLDSYPYILFHLPIVGESSLSSYISNNSSELVEFGIK